MNAAVAPQPIPVAKIKSFGPVGPQYEVGPPLRRLDDGDRMVEITIVARGEKAEYRRSRPMDDPQAE
jgi:hypothetical protein